MPPNDNNEIIKKLEDILLKQQQYQGKLLYGYNNQKVEANGVIDKWLVSIVPPNTEDKDYHSNLATMNLVRISKPQTDLVATKEVAISGRKAWDKSRVLTYISVLINEIGKTQGIVFTEVQAGFRPGNKIIDISANTNVDKLNKICTTEMQSLLEKIKGTNFTKTNDSLTGMIRDVKIFRSIKYKYYLLGYENLEKDEQEFINKLKDLKAKDRLTADCENIVKSSKQTSNGLGFLAGTNLVLHPDGDQGFLRGYYETMIGKNLFPNLDGIITTGETNEENRNRRSKIKGVLEAYEKIHFVTNKEGKAKDTQHAETKILNFWMDMESNNRDNEEVDTFSIPSDEEVIIAGVMRPCFACAVYFHLMGKSHLIGDKVGPYWQSKAAVLSIANNFDAIRKLKEKKEIATTQIVPDNQWLENLSDDKKKEYFKIDNSQTYFNPIMGTTADTDSVSTESGHKENSQLRMNRKRSRSVSKPENNQTEGQKEQATKAEREAEREAKRARNESSNESSNGSRKGSRKGSKKSKERKY